MFFRPDRSLYPELSFELNDGEDWDPNALRCFEFLLDVSVLAIEPVSGLLAVGMLSKIECIQTLMASRHTEWIAIYLRKTWRSD